jgi:mediator of RNA polymerase II transcription subunit 17
MFKRRAVAHLSHFSTSGGENLVFPSQERTKLRVSLRRRTENGETISSQKDYDTGSTKNPSLHDQLSRSQRQLVEQEIFDELIKEASYLPTMSARVSERQIAVEAAQGVELQFDMVLVPHNRFDAA